jgi:HPt (histidine-containing phosphotransfer) domain-containing protein
VSSFEVVMQELKQEYLQALPGRIAVIENNWEMGEWDRLRDEFHKLKGTGKTYGLPEVTELGGLLEEACVQQPHSLSKVFSEAISLLRHIYAERRAERSVHLEHEARFERIQQVLSA